MSSPLTGDFAAVLQIGDWTFFAVPFLVLPLVMLFRFVGCSPFGVAPSPTDKRPGYRDFIMGVTNNPGTVPFPKAEAGASAIIAYWRLIDRARPDGSLPPAKDEKGFAGGIYVKPTGGIPPQPPTSTTPGSEGASGDIIPTEPGLISTDIAESKLFEGGFMMVPFVAGLYTGEMTIECWIKADWTPGLSGFEHTLFSAGGSYTAPGDSKPAFHGFRIFADRNNMWQVVVFPQVTGVLSASTLVTLGQVKYLVVTISNDMSGGAPTGNVRIDLWVDANKIDSGLVPTFSLPNGAAFCVGVRNSATDILDPSATVPTDPILSNVQEVVLYNRALTLEEILNHFALNQPLNALGGE
jgi:hypothetical protein